MTCKHRAWIILTTIFSASAMLTVWVVAMVVYAPIGVLGWLANKPKPQQEDPTGEKNDTESIEY